MLKQFNLQNKVFADPILLTNAQGEPILTEPPAQEVGLPQYTTSGEDWYAVNTQEEINQISASITGNGEVWVENGKIHCSGKRPDEMHRWDKSTKSWVKLTAEQQADLLAEKRQEVQSKINAKRDECVNGGVYVPEINKWVDTDDVGRATLVEIKADFDLNGKDNTYTLICADNSAQPLDFNQFKAVWDAVKNLKEKMFENAYMHKVLLEADDNPEHYDYSIGWAKTYQEHLNEQTN